MDYLLVRLLSDLLKHFQKNRKLSTGLGLRQISPVTETVSVTGAELFS
jgi:hypothetical protein